MSATIFIPTAGTGSRLKKLTRFRNKSLIDVAGKPIISHIFEKFSKDDEFVIALGYKSDYVRQYINLVHSNLNIKFIEIECYEGVKSGLGRTLLDSKKLLQKPFLFYPCDAIVLSDLPKFNHDWVSYTKMKNCDEYRTINSQKDELISFNEKENNSNSKKAYSGISFIKNFKKFWKVMESNENLSVYKGEVYGIEGIKNFNKIKSYEISWYDIGNIEQLETTKKKFNNKELPVILEKETEAIWFVNKEVVKFSIDKEFIKNRCLRGKALKNFTPTIIKKLPNFYKYDFTEGKILSEVVNEDIFEKFLIFCKNFWLRQNLNKNQQSNFIKNCSVFYKNKTKERIDLFYKKFNQFDNTLPINGKVMPLLSEILDNLDWRFLSEGCPGRFHGDFHFENILWEPKKEKFILLDWRQDFSGDLFVGDIYYDLAKLTHGLIVNHKVVSKNEFSINWSEKEINFKIKKLSKLRKCEKTLNKWINKNGYSLYKVRVLTALIFLNISALHHNPYSLFLYALGKKMLFEEGIKHERCY